MPHLSKLTEYGVFTIMVMVFALNSPIADAQEKEPEKRRSAESGQRRSPEAEAGRRRSPEADAGRRRSPEAEVGRRRSPEAEGGRKRSPEAEVGRRRSPEANLLNDFKPQTPREAALVKMILELRREVAELRAASRSGGRGGDARRNSSGLRDVAALPANWQRTKAGGVFRAYDKNGDQFVDLDEWLAMTNGNISPARRELQTKRFFDTGPGSDRKLDPAEFIHWRNQLAAPRSRGREREGGRRSPEAEADARRSSESGR